MSKTKDADPPAPQEILPPVPGAKSAKAGKDGKAPERDDELEGLMSEIESDLREEELRKIWSRYGNTIMVVMSVILLSVVGFQLWRQHDAEQRLELATRYDEAQVAVTQGKVDDALAMFADIAKARGEGYATLAALDRAALLLKKSDTDGAVAIYRSIAADTKADRVFRDLATVLTVMHTMDAADPKTLEPMLSPLTTPANPFHNIAIELSAVLAGKSGDRVRAAKLAEQLIGDATTPPDMRQRAEELAAFYKSSAELPKAEPVLSVNPAPAATAPAAPTVAPAPTPAPAATAPAAPPAPKP